MNRIELVVAANTSNETVITVIDVNGLPLDFDSLNVESMSSVICDGYYAHCPQKIEVDFLSNVITAKFGTFNLMPGTYYPKIYYFVQGNTVPFVITGKGFNTEIIMHSIC